MSAPDDDMIHTERKLRDLRVLEPLQVRRSCEEATP